MNALIISLLMSAIAIEHVKVETGDGTVLEDVTVVLDGGKIISVGTAAAPVGATRIDGTGKVLTPGLIDSASLLGLREIDAEGQSVDDTLRDGAMAPAFRAIDGFNPLSTRIPIARADGVTSALLIPRGGVLAGTGYAVSLTGSLDELPDPKKPLVMSGDFGGDGAAMLGGARGGQWLKLRTAFADARWYAKNKTAVEQNRARDLSLPPVQLEALLPVLEGRLPMLIWVHRASDVLAVLRFAKEEKVKVIIGGASEAWLVADALKAAGVPVLLTPSEQVPNSFDQLHARDDAATLLEKAGVTVVVVSGDGMRRRLRQEAGIAVAYGFPRGKAIEAITGRPAKVLGLSEVGVVKPGLRADVVLWSGDPLELSTVAEKVFIGGVEQSLVTRETKLVERYLQRVPAKK